MKKLIGTLVICVCMGIFCYAGYRIYDHLQESKEANDSYAALSEYISIPTVPDQTAEPIKEPTQSECDCDEQSEILWPEVDFAALKAVNTDVVGWLYCEGTEINYPVVQGSDNSYYLTHLFDGSYNVNGCLFVDCRLKEPLESRHNIIYGHHMKNGKMFHALDGYKNQEFYDQHPEMLLLTPDANYVMKIFTGYVANLEDDAWKLGFSTDEYMAWLDNAKTRSCFDSQVLPTAEDSILTLSTCSYEFSDARFVVVGVLRKHD